MQQYGSLHTRSIVFAIIYSQCKARWNFWSVAVPFPGKRCASSVGTEAILEHIWSIRAHLSDQHTEKHPPLQLASAHSALHHWGVPPCSQPRK